MKGSLLKGTAFAFALLVCMGFGASDIFASTGVYVGKDASAEGTTLIGASVEADIGLTSVPVILEKGIKRKGDTVECSNGFVFTMPVDNLKVVLDHLMSYGELGRWNACASNEKGVSVVATITTDPNLDAATADPFVADGVSEEKLAFILASTSETAKDAVKTLCLLYDEVGAAAAEIVLIADQEGAWVVENYTGHEYVATKLPDDLIATFSNDPIIKTVDPDDENTICSSKLLTLPVENDFAVYDDNNDLDLILTYNYDNAYVDDSHIRGWAGHEKFAPSEKLEYGVDLDYDVFFKPDDKVALADVFDFFRWRFEGTKFDLADTANSAGYWGINNQRVSNVNIIQVFSDVPAPLSTVLWTTPADPTTSPFIPIPVIADSIPAEFSTDVEDDSYQDGILQFEFSGLNTRVLNRRKAYGESIKQYWEGIESLSTANVAESVRGKWKDAFSSSEKEAKGLVEEFVTTTVGLAGENCERLDKELEWYLFRNGIKHPNIADADVTPFECSFDAVSYANANGWETTVKDGVFTATKDGKTIEVVFEGDDKGKVSFTGFDNEELSDEFGEEAPAEAVEYTTEETVEEETVEEAAEEKTSEEKAEPEKTEKPAEEKKEEPAKETVPEEKKADKDAAEDLTEKAAKQVEVDTIAELEDYFAEKIADVPRDGWAENEIVSEIAGVSNDVAGIISRNFNGDIDDILGFDEAKAQKILNDPDLLKAADRLTATGLDLTMLFEKYFNSLAEDVTGDVVSGRITQDGAIKILNEAEADIEGIARLYLEGIAGKFAEVFDSTLSDEELAEIFSELGQGTLDLMEDYGAIDKSALGIEDLDLNELTQADINVVITLDAMDDETIDGLSDLLGVDVRATLDEYLKQIDESSDGKVKVIEEKHELPKAESAPDEEIMAAIELEESLSEEDIIIPQEVIDILNEAIAEATGSTTAEPAEDEKAVEEVAPATETPADEKAPADKPADTTDAEKTEAPANSGEYSANIPNVSATGGKVMLPALMIKYFK